MFTVSGKNPRPDLALSIACQQSLLFGRSVLGRLVSLTQIGELAHRLLSAGEKSLKSLHEKSEIVAACGLSFRKRSDALMAKIAECLNWWQESQRLLVNFFFLGGGGGKEFVGLWLVIKLVQLMS